MHNVFYISINWNYLFIELDDSFKRADKLEKEIFLNIWLKLTTPLNTNSIEQSLIGYHIHYMFGPVSQGEKNWVYKQLLVLEMFLGDISEARYLFGVFC